jgi:hypothetical protein
MTPIRHSFFVICLLLTLPLFALAQQDTTILIKAQQNRFAAMMARDTAALEQLIDSGLVYVHSNGLTQDKTDFIQSIAKGTIIYQRMDIRERRARLYPGTGIITGMVAVKGVLNGTPFDVLLRFIDVFYYDKDWKMISWQSQKVVN